MRVPLLILVSCYVAAIHASPSIDRETEEGFQNGGLLRERADRPRPTGEPKPTVEAETMKCEEMGGKCMSKKDKKKCAGTAGVIDKMGKCVGKNVCCVAGGPKPTGEPEDMECEELGGKCMSKKDKKKCAGNDGTIDKMGKCEVKKDVCCVAGGPEAMKCEELGGKCMSKKDKKKCSGTAGAIDIMGKCEGKKDVCCVAAPPTESPILVPGNCPTNVIDAFASKHVCPSCTADAGGIAVLEYVNDPTYKFPPKDADDGVLIFGLTLLGHPITYGLKNDYCKCGFLNRVPVWLCDEPKQDQHGVWIYTDCSRAHNPDRGFGDYICFAYANLKDGTMVPNSLDCTTQ